MMVARNSGLSPSLVWPVGVTDFFFLGKKKKHKKVLKDSIRDSY